MFQRNVATEYTLCINNVFSYLCYNTNSVIPFLETTDLLNKVSFCYTLSCALRYFRAPTASPVLPSLPFPKTCARWQSARCAHTQETSLVSLSKVGSHWAWREAGCQFGHRATLVRAKEDLRFWYAWHYLAVVLHLSAKLVAPTLPLHDDWVCDLVSKWHIPWQGVRTWIDHIIHVLPLTLSVSCAAASADRALIW